MGGWWWGLLGQARGCRGRSRGLLIWGKMGRSAPSVPATQTPPRSPGERWLGKTQVEAALTRPRHGPRLPDVTVWITQGTLYQSRVAAHRVGAAAWRLQVGGSTRAGPTRPVLVPVCLQSRLLHVTLTSAVGSAVVVCWAGGKCFRQTTTSQVPCSHRHGNNGETESQGG